MLSNILKHPFFKPVIQADEEKEKMWEAMKKEHEELNSRVDSLIETAKKATVNGENKWMLKLVPKEETPTNGNDGVCSG